MSDSQKLPDATTELIQCNFPKSLLKESSLVNVLLVWFCSKNTYLKKENTLEKYILKMNLIWRIILIKFFYVNKNYLYRTLV